MDDHKRIRTRISYSAHALVKSSVKGVTKGMVRDISIDAIYLLCKPIFTLQEKVNVEIFLIGKESELIIRVPARVTRKDQDGIALCFNNPLEWWPIFSHFPLHKIQKEPPAQTE